MSSHMKVVRDIKLHVVNEMHKLKSKVFCECGKKLEYSQKRGAIECPDAMRVAAIRLVLLKKNHKPNKWGKVVDAVRYDALNGVMNIIREGGF